MRRSRSKDYLRVAGFVIACIAAVVLFIALVASELLSTFGDFSFGWF